AAELALAVVDHPRDSFLDYAARQTTRELKPVWIPAVLAGRLNVEGKIQRLIFAVEATQATELIPRLVDDLQAGKVADEHRSQVLELIGALGQPQHLRLVLDQALAAGAPPAETAELLKAVLTAQRRRNTRPAGELLPVAQLLQSPAPEVAILAAECLASWKLTAAMPELQAIATSSGRLEALRKAAILALAALDSDETRNTLQDLAANETAESVSAAAVAALVPLQPQLAAKISIEWLRKSTSPEEQGHVVQAFLQKQGAPDLLASALSDQTLPEDVAKIALRSVTGSGREEPKLIAALTQAGGIRSEPKLLTAAQMAEMVAEIRGQGDPARGEAIFRRTDLSCFKCHAIGGAGG
ncbi:MAG: hypothetical protein B7Z55_17975, partial [Planctomycetales bacterium 12-60-4]